jgi:hypothetical protein
VSVAGVTESECKKGDSVDSTAARATASCTMVLSWCCAFATSDAASKMTRECLGGKGNPAIAFPAVVSFRALPVAGFVGVELQTLKAAMCTNACSAFCKAAAGGAVGNGKLMICTKPSKPVVIFCRNHPLQMPSSTMHMISIVSMKAPPIRKKHTSLIQFLFFCTMRVLQQTIPGLDEKMENSHNRYARVCKPDGHQGRSRASFTSLFHFLCYWTLLE